MYPNLKINLNKIYDNTVQTVQRAGKHGIDITAVTKCVAGNPGVADAFISAGVRALGDSRIRNLKDLAGFDCEKWLIRIPNLSEIEDIVQYATLSLNSELSVLKALDQEAARQNKIHDVVLMIDIGDLREGWFDLDGFWRDFDAAVSLKHIRIRGIGTNTNCAGAVIPEPQSYSSMQKIRDRIRSDYNLDCDTVSGGNSGSWYMVENDTIPEVVTNLRLGEVILFGSETSYGRQPSYLHSDAFTLEAEIVELKEKPSMPIGLKGKDAFGKEPVFTDLGRRRRAICAIGKQDVTPEDIFPLDSDTQIVTASSDHLIVDVTDSAAAYKVGDIMRFRCNYVSALRASTSLYIENDPFIRL